VPLLFLWWGSVAAPCPRQDVVVQGARKVLNLFHFPDKQVPVQHAESLCIYRRVGYRDISFERLTLNLYVTVKPVERAATVERVHFQDVRLNGLPVSIKPLDQEFKLSQTAEVDLPAPLEVSVLFADLDSIAPLRDLIQQDKLKITGHSFFEIKLNPLGKVFLRSQRLVLPVDLNEEVPLQLFAKDSPVQAGAIKLLEMISDPTSIPGLALAREHLAKLEADRSLNAVGKGSLYLVNCDYVLRDPATGQSQKFSQSGTAFAISADGKLLTAKRVLQPWKFDPEIALLLARNHLEVDQAHYGVTAWPGGSRVLTPEGSPDITGAFSTERKTLEVVKTAADQMQSREVQDPDTGDKATVKLATGGADDTALIKITADKLEPLATADPEGGDGFLFGFPFGMSQSHAEPRRTPVHVTVAGELRTLDHKLNPGEAGAPLISADGKVLALCGEADECIPIAAALAVLQK
jgi:trypsin-like peptidase